MRKYYFPDEGGGGDKPSPAPPSNYRVRTPQERKDWNDFLDYLGQQGVGGSAELDKRDQKLGLSYLGKWQKLHPETTVTAEAIPQIQYDQYLLRKGDHFPGITDEQLKYMRNGLNPAYLNRPVSDIDGWLGSLTSKQYYPTSERADNKGHKYVYGTDFESYLNGLTDPSINSKFLVKSN